MPQIWAFYAKNHVLITVIVGVVIITVNTLWIFLTRPLHGDMVAQQLAVQQWLHGVPMEGLMVGPTNYIIKLPFYVLIEGLFGWLSPFMRLVATSLFMTIGGWVFSLWITRRIIHTYVSKDKIVLMFVSLLFILVAIGSSGIYLLNFPNSRNIEVALMLAAIYLYIRASERARSKWDYILLFIVTFLIYINDKYALYVVGGAAAVYLAARIIMDWYRRKPGLNLPACYTLTVVVLTLIAHALATPLITAVTPIDITWSPPAEVKVLSVEEVGERVTGLSMAIVQNLGMPIIGKELNLRLYPYLVTLVLVLYLLILFITGRKSRYWDDHLMHFLVTVMAVSLALPLASGLTQPRYIIIFPFVLIIFATILFNNVVTNRAKYHIKFLSVGTLLGAILFAFLYIPMVHLAIEKENWRIANREIYQLIRIANENEIEKAYMTMQHAQPVTYLNPDGLLALPLSCEDDASLGVNDVLIERSTIQTASPNSMVYIGPKKISCLSREQVVKQIKLAPVKTVLTSSGGTVFIYDKDIKQYLGR